MAKNSDFQSMADLMEEKKKLEKKMSKIMIPCSHTNSNGKLKVDFIGRGSDCKCKKCGAVFSFDQVQNDEAADAVRTIHNMINQIKALSDDPEKEYAVIKELGSMDYNLKELCDLYSKTISSNTRGKKKKNKHNDNVFGAYGTGNIKFI